MIGYVAWQQSRTLMVLTLKQRDERMIITSHCWRGREVSWLRSKKHWAVAELHRRLRISGGAVAQGNVSGWLRQIILPASVHGCLWWKTPTKERLRKWLRHRYEKAWIKQVKGARMEDVGSKLWPPIHRGLERNTTLTLKLVCSDPKLNFTVCYSWILFYNLFLYFLIKR